MLIAPPVAWGGSGGGDIAFPVSGAANVEYSHDFRVGKIGLKCRACHEQIFHTVSRYGKKTMTTCREASPAEPAIREGGRSI